MLSASLRQYSAEITWRDLALLRPDSTQNLRRARQLLEDARTGGVMLTEESLDELLSLIGELEEAEEN